MQNGRAYLDEYMSNIEEFGTLSCKIIVCGDIDISLRKYIGVLFKNIIKDDWTSPKFI